MMPGLAGSGLMARMMKANVPHCSSNPVTTDWYRLWASITALSPPHNHQLCWFESIKLVHKTPTFGGGVGHWQSPPGIEVQADPGLHGVDYLDYVEGYGISPTRYFHDLIESFRSVGYTEHRDLEAFPYDWRLPVWQLDWSSFKETIQRLRQANGAKVVLFAHSLGALAINYFLQTQVTQQWKDDNVNVLISLNGAYGGSMKVARALLSGYNPADLPFLKHWSIPQPVNDIDVRDISQTFASLYMLTPHSDLYGEDFPVVSVRSSRESTERDYYVTGNWSAMLPASEVKESIIAVRKAIRPYAISDPGVPVVCLWSVFDDPVTEAYYVYTDFNFNETPSISMVAGDGTLPLTSLRVCSHWKSTVLAREFRNLDHMYVLRDKAVTTYITDVIGLLGGGLVPILAR